MLMRAGRSGFHSTNINMKDSDFKKIEKEFEKILLLQLKLDIRIKRIQKELDDNKQTIF